MSVTSTATNAGDDQDEDLAHVVQISSHLLATFNTKLLSEEDHFNSFISCCKGDSQVNYRVLYQANQDFIKQIFFGCVKYSKTILVLVEGFYNKDGRNILKADQPLLHVLSYLALFHLHEMGVEQYHRCVNCLDDKVAFKFFKFFFNEKNLVTWVKDGWRLIYDASYVQTNLLNPILGWLDKLQEINKHLNFKINNHLRPKKPILHGTETKPFTLTQPKPRKVFMPDPIPSLKKHSPVPRSLYSKASPEQEAIERKRQDNRHLAEERLMEASRKQFTCANPEKSQRTKEILQNIYDDQASQLDFDGSKARKVPSFVNKDIPVKINAAAILREGLLYQKIESAEIKKLGDLEAGVKNKLPFEEWQKAMRQKDLEADIAEVESRRLMGRLSYEEAILARQALTLENHNRVAEMKKEADCTMHRFLVLKLKEEQEARSIVSRTLEGHKNTRNARRRLQETNKKIVQQMSHENKALLEQALRDAERDMQQKLSLIRQIHAAETCGVPRKSCVDLTATSGAQLLSEMSIVEVGLTFQKLKERLSLLRVARTEAEERKREEILVARQAKDQHLIDTLETISKHRLEQARSAALRPKVPDDQKRQCVVKSEKLSELQKQVAERRKARVESRQSSNMAGARIATRSIVLSGPKKALEEKRWRELERSRQRSTRLLFSDNVDDNPINGIAPALGRSVAIS